MKLFKSSCTSGFVIDLDNVVYAFRAEWLPWGKSIKKDLCPSIKVGLTKKDSIELRYDKGEEWTRDQDYDNLIKALEGND